MDVRISDEHKQCALLLGSALRRGDAEQFLDTYGSILPKDLTKIQLESYAASKTIELKEASGWKKGALKDGGSQESVMASPRIFEKKTNYKKIIEKSDIICDSEAVPDQKTLEVLDHTPHGLNLSHSNSINNKKGDVQNSSTDLFHLDVKMKLRKEHKPNINDLCFDYSPKLTPDTTSSKRKPISSGAKTSKEPGDCKTNSVNSKNAMKSKSLDYVFQNSNSLFKSSLVDSGISKNSLGNSCVLSNSGKGFSKKVAPTNTNETLNGNKRTEKDKKAKEKKNGNKVDVLDVNANPVTLKAVDSGSVSKPMKKRENNSYHQSVELVEAPLRSQKKLSKDNSPENGSKAHKKNRRRNDPYCLAEEIPNYMGEKDIDVIINFIEKDNKSKIASDCSVNLAKNNSSPKIERKKKKKQKDEEYRHLSEHGAVTNKKVNRTKANMGNNNINCSNEQICSSVIEESDKDIQNSQCKVKVSCNDLGQCDKMDTSSEGHTDDDSRMAGADHVGGVSKVDSGFILVKKRKKNKLSSNNFYIKNYTKSLNRKPSQTNCSSSFSSLESPYNFSMRRNSTGNVQSAVIAVTPEDSDSESAYSLPASQDLYGRNSTTVSYAQIAAASRSQNAHDHRRSMSKERKQSGGGSDNPGNAKQSNFTCEHVICETIQTAHVLISTNNVQNVDVTYTLNLPERDLDNEDDASISNVNSSEKDAVTGEDIVVYHTISCSQTVNDSENNVDASPSIISTTKNHKLQRTKSLECTIPVKFINARDKKHDHKMYNISFGFFPDVEDPINELKSINSSSSDCHLDHATPSSASKKGLTFNGFVVDMQECYTFVEENKSRKKVIEVSYGNAIKNNPTLLKRTFCFLLDEEQSIQPNCQRQMISYLAKEWEQVKLSSDSNPTRVVRIGDQ